MRTARVLASVAVLALLTGCTDAGVSADPTSTPDRLDTADRTSPGAEDADGADPSGGTGLAGDDLAACMVGTWELDLGVARDIVAATVAATGAEPPSELVVTGSASVVITDAELAWEYEAYTTELRAIQPDGTEYHSVAVQDGRATSRYELRDGLLTTTPLDMSGSTYDLTRELDGVAAPLSAEEHEALVNRVGRGGAGTTRVTCTADELAMVPVVNGTEITQMAMVLTRG